MTAYTAAQVREMVTHIEGCADCCGNDEEMRASLYDESLPPEELAEYIAVTHSADWADFLARHGAADDA